MPSLTELANRVTSAERAKPIGQLALRDFAHSGRVVRIWSDVLGEEVIFAADDAQIDTDEDGLSRGCVVYRAAELSDLLAVGEETLRLVNELKKCFNGRIV